MLETAIGAALLAWCGAVAHAGVRGSIQGRGYASPGDAAAEVEALARAHPDRARLEAYGRSREGRALQLLRIGNPEAPARLLVTAQIHAGEYVAGAVGRAVARALLERAADPAIASLLAGAEVLVAPLLNPDGAQRVWDQRGWIGLRGMRFTQGGVDPNRNFPFEPLPGSKSWNSASSQPGDAHYRGPQPLSEPECAALAELCEREGFCAAVNFHSFGAVIYKPALVGPYDRGDDPVARGLAVFDGAFQDHQPHRRYRPVPEEPSAIEGQLDAWLLGAHGVPSVTVEVGRPGLTLAPGRAFNPFWLSNPRDPSHWLENDVDATLFALGELLRATGGEPGTPRQPALATATGR